MTTAMTGPAAIRAAYAHCEEVTRIQARNFSYGIRLLPPPKRRALSAVYAFARRIDDIGDGALPPEQKLAALQSARADVAAVADDLPRASPSPALAGDPVLVALSDAAGRYPIPLGAFGELIEGCEADVRGTPYPTFSDLEHYCRCVAGSIGRLSLGVFGSRAPGTAEPLADALGVALQLTNILRDIQEDFLAGRVYLPADDLARFGCTLTPPAAPGSGGQASNGDGSQARLPVGQALERLVEFEAQRALGWYRDGLRLLPLLDRRSAACTGAMAGIYLRLLEQICAAPAAALAHRMSVPPRAKAMVAARSLAGRAPRPRPAARPGAAGPDKVTTQEARP